MLLGMTVLRPRLLPDTLALAIGSTSAPLSPTQGLRLAEQLARASFRAVLEDEARRLDPPSPAPRTRRSTTSFRA